MIVNHRQISIYVPIIAVGTSLARIWHDSTNDWHLLCLWTILGVSLPVPIHVPTRLCQCLCHLSDSAMSRFMPVYVPATARASACVCVRVSVQNLCQWVCQRLCQHISSRYMDLPSIIHFIVLICRSQLPTVAFLSFLVVTFSGYMFAFLCIVRLSILVLHTFVINFLCPSLPLFALLCPSAGDWLSFVTQPFHGDMFWAVALSVHCYIRKWPSQPFVLPYRPTTVTFLVLVQFHLWTISVRIVYQFVYVSITNYNQGMPF